MPEELFIENEYKEFYNVNSYQFSVIIGDLRRITGINLPNMFEVFRDVTWYFNEFFASKGLNYFGKNCYLRVVLDGYFRQIFRYYDDLCEQFLYMACCNCQNFVSDLYLKKYSKRINYLVKETRKTTIDNLPDIFELCLYNKVFLSSLLPDACPVFVKECLKELEILGFDIKKDIDIEAVKIEENNLVSLTKKFVDLQTLAERVSEFDDFVNSYYVDIPSRIAYVYNKKNQCRL